ncbi:hypothetical protein MVEN_02012400 [Mycena venus]|uniref:DUF7598 domain-containing protein n=1 Tax=Mycena venus TaxID=2733690 RepID=A0A8H6XAX7_9AGAR|nr:hypothetical protein MVEN_02012400 [Mycena venus]
MARLVFLGLNAARVLSVVALLLVFSSSILVMVTNIKAVNRFQADRITNSTDSMLDCDYIEGSTVPNQPAGVFWAVVAGLLIIFQVIILLLSELGWPAVFFDRFFPVLGADFGLGALGIFQCLIGAQILSHHVDDFTLVSAFFLFSIGCLNMLLGLIFREGAKSKRSLRGKRDANKGPIIAAGPQFVNANANAASPQFVNNVFPDPEKAGTDNVSFASWKSTDKAGYGFGRQGEKAAGLRGFILQRPEESLPRYASPTPTYAAAPPAPEQRAPSPSRSHSGSHKSGKSRSHRSRREPSPRAQRLLALVDVHLVELRLPHVVPRDDPDPGLAPPRDAPRRSMAMRPRRPSTGGTPARSELRVRPRTSTRNKIDTNDRSDGCAVYGPSAYTRLLTHITDFTCYVTLFARQKLRLPTRPPTRLG